MVWRIVLILVGVFTACTIRFHRASYPRFEFTPALESSADVLRYEQWSVTQAEFFDAFPEFRAFNEEVAAVQTAVALKKLISKYGVEQEYVITGSSKEACSMAFSRLGAKIDDKKLIFKDAQNKSTIAVAGKTFEISQMTLNHMELARLQSTYYIKGQGAAEQLLIKKIISESEKKTITEKLEVFPDELKSYLRKYNIDPKAIGMIGIRKIKEELVQKKEHEAFKNYAHHKIYKYPVQSRWKKPTYTFERLPEKPFVIGRGHAKLMIFAPYDCKACLDWNQELPQFMTPDIEIKYYPAISDASRKSSMDFYASVLCMSEQKSDIVWKILARFKHIYSRATLNEKFSDFMAQEGIKEDQYNKCMTKNKYDQRLDHYQKFSQELGVNTFPVVVAGNFVFTGDINPDDVREALEAEQPFLMYKFGRIFSKK